MNDSAAPDTSGNRPRYAVPTDSRVTRWYAEMTPSWLDIEPVTRRRLVLRTHRWLADEVFSGTASLAELLEDLGPAGGLTTALEALVPAHETARWQPWLRTLRHDLRRALAWPISRRTDPWCRWLFLIPYSIPVPSTRSSSPARPERPAERRLI